MSPTKIIATNDSDGRNIFDLSTSKLTPEDAIKCLTGEYNVIVPTPNVRPCNNLDEYFHRSTLNSRKTPSKDAHNQSLNSSRTSLRRHLREPSEPFCVPLVRNFEKILKSNPPQESSPSSQPTHPKKPRPDVFNRTDQIDANSGPLSHLKKRMNETVRVMIRRRKKVPYISRVIEYRGTLVLFDKHMNLYLKDVIEAFTYEREGKILKRGRHRDGIILRGDNVILVA